MGREVLSRNISRDGSPGFGKASSVGWRGKIPSSETYPAPREAKQGLVSCPLQATGDSDRTRS